MRIAVGRLTGLVALCATFLSACSGTSQDNPLAYGRSSTGSEATPGATRADDIDSRIRHGNVVVSENALFFDSFEYEAGRNDSGVTKIFRNNGWSAVKTQQVSPERNPRGYVYTTDTVPGYTGAFPGANSRRVLAMEALPTTLGRYRGPDTFWGDMQTDFYLQYGGANQSAGTVPADVWFQFWMYTTGGMTGGFVRSQSKFLYPCNGNYPCQNASWLLSLGTTSAHPHWVELSNDSEPRPDVFLRLQGNDAVWTPGHYAEHDLGHTDTSELIRGQRWVLVTIHIDTSGPQGTYEAWLRPVGGREVKVAEHIGGVTPGFEWPVSDNSGHRVLRMPTTLGNRYVVQNYPESYDVTFYIDDFAIATSREGLPTYD